MEQLKLGWGRREISVEGPVSIPGQTYMRLSEGIQDPLYVTALVVDGGAGQDHVVFCSCDIVTLTNEVIPGVCKLVASLRPEINTDAIVMNATHTHSGCNIRPNQPTVSPDGKAIYPADEYKEFFMKMCAEAIVEAWDSRAEGGIGYGYGYAVVAHTRRVVYFHDQSLKSNSVAPNGHCIMYGNTNDPDFSHYEGGADHFLNLMFTFDKANKLTGIVANVPCPSQVTEQLTRLSADYWHDVRQLLAEEFGADVFLLPQCGAAGDLAPRILHYWQAQARRMALKYDMGYDIEKAKVKMSQDDLNKRFAERKDIAERIVAGIKEVYGWAKKEIFTHLPVSHRSWKQPMERRFVTDEELHTCEAKLEELKTKIPEKGDDPVKYRRAVSQYNAVKRRNETILYRHGRQYEFPAPPITVHAVAIGDIAFATNKFELYHDFMHRVQARSPFTQTFVLQLAGDEGGTYLATKRSEENKGYGASLFCNWIGHVGGQQWVEGVLENLNEMKQEQEEQL